VLGSAAEKNVSAAERLREQMRRDMLSELGTEDDILSVGKSRTEGDASAAAKASATMDEVVLDETSGVDWDEQVSGTKRVLSMDVSAKDESVPADALTPLAQSVTHLRFLLSQLRHEHLFCFWCAFKYASYDEMEGPGGCPGEEEDDH
jgi:hypothetical protein